nr:unnamed protein product [Callosobruchus analis]
MRDTINKQRKSYTIREQKSYKNRVKTQQQFLDMLKQTFHMGASSESELKVKSLYGYFC